MTDSNTIFQGAAAIAATSKKPTKNQAYEHMRSLLEGLDNDESLEDHAKALIDLYAHFMPSLPSKPKTAYQWLAKAASKNDVRYYLQFVYVQDGDAVATNGHTLHIIRNVNWEDGWYNPNTGDKATPPNNKYPDYERVLPSTLEHYQHNGSNWQEWPQYEYKQKVLAVQIGNNVWVDRTYLVEAMQGFNVPAIFYSEEPNAPVVVADWDTTDIKSAQRIAVVMPVRI